MPVSMRIEGIDAILLKLKQRQKVAQRFNGTASVVYEAPYAIFVHERMDLHHPVGQAKFLEQPAREYRRIIGDRIAADVKSGIPLPTAILRGAEFLKEKSQALCPVDTGFLKESAHVVADFKDFVTTFDVGGLRTKGNGVTSTGGYSKRVIKTAFRNIRRR